MKVCGIELKANNIIFSIIESINNEYNYIDTQIKKISLVDDENQKNIIKFKLQVEKFISQNLIEKIIIKKRAKKGNFAGGALTFKIESIIQLNSLCEVIFISSQAISRFSKSNNIIFPQKLNKYQEQAYLASVAYLW
ncbi:hypothetical protein MNB_ARC-1_386 [hydrothermal vent metagenome]|uniref:DUF3010 domain-containing protein n=1 Tax=hydrothermal vent metagenome TaxID=652676 RepID=A0A3B1EA71_9ZZZZ